MHVALLNIRQKLVRVRWQPFHGVYLEQDAEPLALRRFLLLLVEQAQFLLTDLHYQSFVLLLPCRKECRLDLLKL